MLTRANVRAGERVLITGVSGGVGSAAVHLAKARGATVWSITTSAKSAALQELGADETISRDMDPMAMPGANRVDVVIDLPAGGNFPRSLNVRRPNGRYAAAGAIAGPQVELDVRTLYLKDLSLFGCTVLEPEVFPNLIRITEQGAIAPVVYRTFPLEQIREAQTLFLEKRHVGKIVLEI